MAHKFIVSTEEVNEYKYRVLTDGIDTEQYLKNPVVLFQHQRFDRENKGSEVIGKCISLTKVDGKLVAEIEFDQEDEFAKKIEGKVERGFIRMTSMYADILATSVEPEDVLQGQLFETVTKCKLVEISIVDIGGNDSALKLTRDGNAVQLAKIQLNKNESMSLKTVAIALGLAADASEDVVLQGVASLQLAKKTAEENYNTLKGDVETQQVAEATTLVDKAIQLGLIPDALKTVQLSAFKGDFENQKVTLSKLISDKETETNKGGKAKLVKDFLGKGKGTESANDNGKTFLQLTKENPAELIRLKREEPETFKELFKAQYGTEPIL